MFLTRMALDTNRPDTRALLTSPALVRREVDDAFAGVHVRCLWRLDVLGRRTYLVLLSPLRPTLGAAHALYGYLGAFPSWETWDYDELLEQTLPGTRWHFLLCASPHGLLTMEESLPAMARASTDAAKEWLCALGASCGFMTTGAEIEIVRSQWFTFQKEPDGALLHCHQILADGLLTVTNEALFQQSFCQGFGECLEWGMGLMTLSAPGSVHYV